MLQPIVDRCKLRFVQLWPLKFITAGKTGPITASQVTNAYFIARRKISRRHHFYNKSKRYSNMTDIEADFLKFILYTNWSGFCKKNRIFGAQFESVKR